MHSKSDVETKLETSTLLIAYNTGKKSTVFTIKILSAYNRNLAIPTVYTDWSTYFRSRSGLSSSLCRRRCLGKNISRNVLSELANTSMSSLWWHICHAQEYSAKSSKAEKWQVWRGMPNTTYFFLWLLDRLCSWSEPLSERSPPLS